MDSQKGYTLEQVINKLRKAEISLSQENVISIITGKTGIVTIVVTARGKSKVG